MASQNNKGEEKMNDDIFLNITTPQTIIINNTIELRITKNTNKKDAYYIDVYKYRTEEEMEDEEYDPDEDFVDGIAFEK